MIGLFNNLNFVLNFTPCKEKISLIKLCSVRKPIRHGATQQTNEPQCQDRWCQDQDEQISHWNAMTSEMTQER